MRNYEIVFLVHPDQSDQTSPIISRLDKLVKESGGNVHRSENIGNRKLAYPIQDQFKASYGLLNIECNQETIDEIKNSFKFNDCDEFDFMIDFDNLAAFIISLKLKLFPYEKPVFSLLIDLIPNPLSIC